MAIITPVTNKSQFVMKIEIYKIFYTLYEYSLQIQTIMKK